MVDARGLWHIRQLCGRPLKGASREEVETDVVRAMMEMTPRFCHLRDALQFLGFDASSSESQLISLISFFGSDFASTLPASRSETSGEEFFGSESS